MNPIVRHFLPSVVRGVYRADDEFGSIKDAQAFQRFVEAKFKFLPVELKAVIRREFKGDEDFNEAQRQLTLDLLEPVQATARRAKTFFQRHAYFENVGTPAEKEADNFLEIQFVRRVLAPLLTDAGLQIVQPQQGLGPYRIDFGIEGKRKFAIEVDGFGKFKERSDLDNFIKRQNYITSHDWVVIRFTYGQIMEGAAVTQKTLHTLIKDDPILNRFLTVQPQAKNAPDLFASSTTPLAMELVNDFYRVQDCFVEAALLTTTPVPVQLKDGFGFGIPFVALAISALYEFLEAVQSVVDLDFQLPEVKVSGCAHTSNFHRLITTSENGREIYYLLDASTVRLNPVISPTPADAGTIRFRQGLTPQEIRERLNYFSKSIFGYPEIKEFQGLVLKRVFDGKHVLGISATGSGKSLCFWLPALLKPGLTLVICPLRSLMRDQRLTLRNYGIASADFINSDVDQTEQRRILEDAKLGYIRLLYISPERLRIKKFLSKLEQLKKAVPVNFFAVDEAHCISEWGHDFRPSYLKLPLLRETLTEGNEQAQLIALTATAGREVKQDMLGILKLREEHVLREPGQDRRRFSYQVVTVTSGSEKTETYQKIMTKDLPKALGYQSLPILLESNNQRKEKSLGIVFCIYADPHGKHSIWDGTAHYLYETMSILEPDARWKSGRGQRKMWLTEAYSTGKVRAFSSKPPTLCPKCWSYAYTSKSVGGMTEEDGNAEEDGNCLPPSSDFTLMADKPMDGRDAWPAGLSWMHRASC